MTGSKFNHNDEINNQNHLEVIMTANLSETTKNELKDFYQAGYSIVHYIGFESLGHNRLSRFNFTSLDEENEDLFNITEEFRSLYDSLSEVSDSFEYHFIEQSRTEASYINNDSKEPCDLTMKDFMNAEADCYVENEAEAQELLNEFTHMYECMENDAEYIAEVLSDMEELLKEIEKFVD